MTPLAVERALLGVDRIALLIYESQHEALRRRESIGTYVHSRCNDEYIFFAGEGEVWGSKRGGVRASTQPDEEISVPNPGSRWNDD